MLQGIINVLKPPGMTSHDVVAFIRRQFAIKQVGHAGTLDPAATGVLPVYIGQATRIIEYAADVDKSYRVELTAGYETDTGDDTGKVLYSAPCQLPTEVEVRQLLTTFIGDNLQVPPMYSAVKIAGRKLYEYARQGIDVERQPRPIQIYAISLLHCSDNRMLFDVTCSKGTYIRTLCTDIGKLLGCPVVMSFLVRTRVGCFHLCDTYTLEEVATQRENCVLPIDAAIQFMEALELTEDQARSFLYGRTIFVAGPDSVPVRAYDGKKQLLGIACRSPGEAYFKPVKVLKRPEL